MTDAYVLPYCRRFRKTDAEETLKKINTVDNYLPEYAERIRTCALMMGDQDEPDPYGFIVAVPASITEHCPGIQSQALVGLCVHYAACYGVPVVFVPADAEAAFSAWLEPQ